MPDTLSVPPSSGLATTNDNNTHFSLPSSTSVAHLLPTFPARRAQPPPAVPSTTDTALATAQIFPSSPSSPSSAAFTLSPSHNTSPATTSSAVTVRMDASPVILFTLQYSVAVVQGVTIYILSVVFSILQLVSGQLNDGSPSNSSSASRKKSVSEEERQQGRQRRRRRRRWSGNGINSTGSGAATFSSTLTTATSTSASSVRGWAQNLIIGHMQSQSNPAEESANAGGRGGGGATPTPGTEAGKLAQRLEVLRFLGSTIANLVGSYARPTSSTPAFSSASGEGAVESTTAMKRQLASSLSQASGAAAAGGLGAGGEMNYSSRIRRALVKTLSGHGIPLPRSIKRVTFNDTLQFHTTTTTITNRQPWTRFGDEDEDEDEEDEDNDETDSTNSSPVLRFFSAGFGGDGASEVALSPEEPMSTSLSPSVPSSIPGGGGGKKVRKNRPPSIMPSARDRRQLQDQDDREDLAAATSQQEVRSSGLFNVVSNGRSIPVSTTTMTTGTSMTGKKLVSTITIALPPLSRPRKQQQQSSNQQQQPQTPVSSIFSIAATSTSSAAGATTTSTTTTTTTTTSMTMTAPTSYTPSSGTLGLASALLSSLMMPAAPGPISDAARSLLTSTSISTPTSAPPTVDTFAPMSSDSDSPKSSTGRSGHLKRTSSAPSKISTFLQQHRLVKQQPQSSQMQGQGLFSPGEYTSSPKDFVSLAPSVSSPTMAGFAKSTTTNTTTIIASTSSAASTTDPQASSCTTTAPTVNVNVRARQPSTSTTSSTSTTTTIALIRPRSLHAIQSTVSSVVAAVVIGTGTPPPSVPTSLTTSMSRSLSPPLSPTTMTTTTTFSPMHQRRRSASIDLGMSVSNLPSSSSSSKEDISTPGAGSAADISPTGSGGRSLMYKLTHPQRYKRELELQLQSQSQKDTSSSCSATSSPSASQVALSPISPTFSPTSSTTSIQETLQPAASSSSTRVVYPFSRTFTDLPASLSYLSDDLHPVHLPPPHTYTPVSASASVSVDNSPSPSSSTTNVAASGEIYQPQPLSLNTLPPVGNKEGIPAVVRESTTPPLSMFFPSPTSQHRAPLPSPTLALSSMKDTLAQLRRSPSPRPPRSVAQDEDGASSAHTTFAACGFSISSSS